MKTLIVCVSVSHGNTRRVAEAMGEVLDATIAEPEQVEVSDLDRYDLVGFGSGIFHQMFHPRLRAFVRALPKQPRGKAFVFATSGFPPQLWPMTRLARRAGFDVIDTFSVRAFDTWAPLRPIGGVNKGRPDAADLEATRAFAAGLRARVAARA
ncbi:flavodoxin family protein [Nocardia sp. CDC160]|uniref:flavodoxin family protein n=1 Tax=Nocardia sp. CDC160 TaxID=3112166 RepID=UPI002DB9BB92|nr:flavodoxin family protein [Nocardia sp. CDC160]MEC3915576.1 flavodoxin family protein [Nocardia sp. CDC160]